MWRSNSHRKRRGGGKGLLSSTNREGETAKQVSMENDQNNPTYLKLTWGTRYLCREKEKEKNLHSISGSCCRLISQVQIDRVGDWSATGHERRNYRALWHETPNSQSQRQHQKASIKPRLAAKWEKKPKQHFLGARSYKCNLFSNATGRSENRHWVQLIISSNCLG